MDEARFVKEAAKLFKAVLKLKGKYEVKEKANLIYGITLDNNLKPFHLEIESPKRGRSAFQTDLCIYSKKTIVEGKNKKKIELPRIVFEFKKGIDTHGIITYSNKAVRHKRIYPYLRYGLIIFDRAEFTKKFFIHNEGIDFCIAVKSLKNLKNILKETIKTEIRMSKILEDTIFGDHNYKFFETELKCKKI